MSLQGFIHCGFLGLLGETFADLPNLDEKSRLRIRDNTEAKGIESGGGGGYRSHSFLNIWHCFRVPIG